MANGAPGEGISILKQSVGKGERVSRKLKKFPSLIALVAVLSAGNSVFCRTLHDECEDGALMTNQTSCAALSSPDHRRDLTPLWSSFVPPQGLAFIPDAGWFFLTGMVLVGLGRMLRHGKG
jgi:hypothetical protein